MIKKILLLCIGVVMCATSCAQRSSKTEVVEDISSEIQNPNIEDLQLRKDIGEMLLVGFRGMKIDAKHHIVRDIRQYHIGGVILFEYDAPSGKHVRNIQSPSQVKALCAQLQALNTERLLIGIDQEGGMVCRLKAKYGFDRVISAQKMSEKGEDTVRRYAKITAKMLNDMGINLNFAPCVDVNVNPNCPIIGKLERSFGSDAETVTKMAKIWLEESSSYDVISCLKHFPGHGSSGGDSHLGLVDVTKSWKQLELDPYKSMINELSVPMIMTTHVINKQLDDHPATLSYKILTQLLREELGFQGVIITDDLGMHAIKKQYDYATAVRMTIEAGADMLCIGNNSDAYNEDVVPQTFDIIYNLVSAGILSAERIHQSAERIRQMKALLK